MFLLGAARQAAGPQGGARTWKPPCWQEDHFFLLRGTRAGGRGKRGEKERMNLFFQEKWEVEGLQTVGILLVVCSSLKLMHFLGLIDITTAGKTNGKRAGERRQVRSGDDDSGERTAGWGPGCTFPLFSCVFLAAFAGVKTQQSDGSASASHLL